MSDKVQEVEATVIEGRGYRDVRFTKGGTGFVASLLCSGVLVILMGLVCALWPGFTVEVASWVVGGSFLVAGIASVAGFVLSGAFAAIAWWALLDAIVDIILGAVFVAHPFAVAGALAWLIGAGLFVAGLAVVAAGVGALRENRLASIALLAGGIVVEAMGVLVIVRPGVLLYCIAAFAVLYGAMLVFLAFRAPRAIEGHRALRGGK